MKNISTNTINRFVDDKKNPVVSATGFFMNRSFSCREKRPAGNKS
jgi:hypothetical protein